MNILYIAYSCNPFKGSEDKIGWNVPIESAKSNKVYVISKEEQREPVEKYLREYPIKNIEFFFVDIPPIYKKVFNGFLYSGRLNIWNRRVFSLAQSLCIQKNIDVIHQITPIEFRAIGNYGKIKNAKYVCGPLGGGEALPKGLNGYIKGHQLIEAIRTLVNHWYRFKLIKFGRLKNCDFLMFANKETQDFLVGGSSENYTRFHYFNNGLISEIGIGKDELKEKEEYKKAKRIFIVAGRLVYRKGHEFLLDALSTISSEYEYECRIVGEGPDLNRLKERCEKDSVLKQHVTIVGGLPYPEMKKEYVNADVFIMPSLRETTGTVLLEAMAYGVPIITINKFGGAILLDDSCGWLYLGKDKDSYIEGLAKIIIECIKMPEEVTRKGKNARKKAEKYIWECKNKVYQEIYSEITGAK